MGIMEETSGEKRLIDQNVSHKSLIRIIFTARLFPIHVLFRLFLRVDE